MSLRFRASLLLPLFLFPAPALAEDFDEALKKGHESYRSGDFDGAITWYAKARQEDPKRWEGHTWQAMALIQMAVGERDKTRRTALTREAESMTAVLVHECKFPFRHPLRQYILGMCARVRGEAERAMDALKKAYGAGPAALAPFESMGLQRAVSSAYGRAIIEFTRTLFGKGEFKQAEPLLRRADALLEKDDVARRELIHGQAIIDDALGRTDAAIEGFLKCLQLYEDSPEFADELKGAIALTYFRLGKLDEGEKLLATAPGDSKNPEVIAARCATKMHRALKLAGSDPAVDAALAHYRKAMATYPEYDRFRLVADFAKLVLHKVGPKNAKAEDALLRETATLLLAEREKRSECPSIYFLLHRMFTLLGDEEQAKSYKSQHEARKKDYEKAQRFDARGRPACG